MWLPEPTLAVVILNLCLKIPLGDGVHSTVGRLAWILREMLQNQAEAGGTPKTL